MTDAPDFAVSNEADQDLPPIPFSISGVYAPSSQKSGTWRESFEAMALPPASIAANMAEMFFMDEASGRRQINPAAVTGFIRDTLPEDDSRRFMNVIYDKNRLVKIDVLIKVMDYLVERYTGFPTGRLSHSSPGGGTTGDGSPGPLGWQD
jgi:hypothetical protein